MKNIIEDYLKLKHLASEKYKDLVDASIKNNQSEKTKLTFKMFLNNFCSMFFSVFAFCFLKSTADLYYGLDFYYTNSPYLIVGFSLALFSLICYNIYINFKTKDSIDNHIDNISSFYIVFSGFFFLGFLSLLLFLFFDLNELGNNDSVIKLCIISFTMFLYYSIDSFLLYFKSNKISKIDKNITSVFNQKLNEYNLLKEKISSKKNEIMNNKKVILELYKLFDTDSISKKEFYVLEDIIKDISIVNKYERKKKEQKEKDKIRYKREFEEYLNIESLEEKLIVND